MPVYLFFKYIKKDLIYFAKVQQGLTIPVSLSLHRRILGTKDD